MRPQPPFYRSMRVELLEGLNWNKGGVLVRAGRSGDVLSYDENNPNASRFSARDLILMVEVGAAKFLPDEKAPADNYWLTGSDLV